MDGISNLVNQWCENCGQVSKAITHVIQKDDRDHMYRLVYGKAHHLLIDLELKT